MTLFGKKSDIFCHLYLKTVKRVYREKSIICMKLSVLWRI